MASANESIITPTTGSNLVDNAGNQWTITSGGQVAENGVTDAGTNQVIEMAYVNGLIWQENASGLWWAQTGGPGNYDGWTSGPGTDNSAGTPLSPLGYPSETTYVVDGADNTYSLTSNQQIAINGVIDPPTSSVEILVFNNGTVYQQNTNGLWYSQTAPNLTTSGWENYPAGTLPVPLPTSPSDTVIGYGQGDIIDTEGDQWTINASGNIVENGVVDAATSNVIAIAYLDGFVWQENASGLWFAKTGGPGSYDGWTSGPGTDNSAGTSTRPFATGTVTFQNGAWLTTPPALGDEIIDDSPVMTITGNVLVGDSINFGQSPNYTLNFSGSVDATIGGGATAGGAAAIVVNLATGADFNGSIHCGDGSSGIGTITVNGPGTFYNDTVSTIDDQVTINAIVAGSGVFSVESSHTHGDLQFMQAVGGGQTINITGGGYGSAQGEVELNSPGTFAGNINLFFGQVILAGLQATSYSIANDILSLYNGSSVIDKLNLTAESYGTVSDGTFGPLSLAVSQTASGVIIHNDSNSSNYTGGGTVLPVHA